MTSDLFASFLALLFVIGLILALFWLMRRFGLGHGGSFVVSGKKSTNEIAILESKAVDPRNRLLVARWRGHDYLIAAGTDGMRIIDKSAADFKEVLAQSENNAGHEDQV